MPASMNALTIFYFLVNLLVFPAFASIYLRKMAGKTANLRLASIKLGLGWLAILLGLNLVTGFLVPYTPKPIFIDLFAGAGLWLVPLYVAIFNLPAFFKRWQPVPQTVKVENQSWRKRR